MSFSRILLALPALAAFALLTSGCAVMEDFNKQQAKAQENRYFATLRGQALEENAVFRTGKGWKSKTYINKALLDRATADNVSIEISLADQRGLLLVHGGIAMDFPLASGKASHPTPTGSYTIKGKEKEYHSNLYGRIVDATGTILVNDADTRKDAVPEGATFTGASMPYWMRLTDSGVGLHVGYVPGGRAASHGCVRLKRENASQIFEIVKVGTPVLIAEKAPALEKK